MLKEMDRIEEIAIWLIHNDLYSSTASLQLMPNPTSISIQDILDFMTCLHDFFPPEDMETISAEALLDKPQIIKLFLAINFGTNQKADKIHEYTAIYMTSWGEFYCRIFSDKAGLLSVEDAVKKVVKQLELPFSGSRMEFYIPQSARKRIKAGPPN
jgi:adenylate cyclase class 1